jgi:cysteine sulfinate desulfinase/cysteine desulfurase-like protein
LTREETLCSLRFGLGRFTTGEEIDYAIGRVNETVLKIARNAGRHTVPDTGMRRTNAESVH